MSMAAIERLFPIVDHLPPSIRDALGRRLRELTGLGLIGLSGATATALMTWSVQDPSLSHATSRAIHNVLGYPGAIGAVVLRQCRDPVQDAAGRGHPELLLAHDDFRSADRYHAVGTGPGNVLSGGRSDSRAH